MEYYERTYTNEQEAREAAKQTKGSLSSFLSIGEHEEIITVYVVRYKQLF